MSFIAVCFSEWALALCTQEQLLHIYPISRLSMAFVYSPSLRMDSCTLYSRTGVAFLPLPNSVPQNELLRSVLKNRLPNSTQFCASEQIVVFRVLLNFVPHSGLLCSVPKNNFLMPA
jgi:hypothetical protein